MVGVRGLWSVMGSDDEVVEEGLVAGVGDDEGRVEELAAAEDELRGGLGDEALDAAVQVSRNCSRCSCCASWLVLAGVEDRVVPPRHIDAMVVPRLTPMVRNSGPSCRSVRRRVSARWPPRPRTPA